MQPAKAPARQQISLRSCTLDSCHIYCSNGVPALEVILYQQFLKRQYNVALDDLARLVQEVSWQSSNHVFSSRGHVSRAYVAWGL